MRVVCGPTERPLVHGEEEEWTASIPHAAASRRRALVLAGLVAACGPSTALTGGGEPWSAPSRSAPPRASVPIEKAAPSAPASASSREPAAGVSSARPAPCHDGEIPIPLPPKEGFIMGMKAELTRDTSHRVRITRPYCLDETEVTADAYRECVLAGRCSPPKGDRWSTYHDKRKGDFPVNMVSYRQAVRYCDYRGKRLPTEAEWEWAAAGPDMRTWPWGDGPIPTCEYVDFTSSGAPKANPAGDVGCFGGGPSAVRAHPKGRKRWPTGDLWAMAGNVWEWTQDSFLPYPSTDQLDPLVTVTSSLLHAIRGGGWNRPGEALRTFFRGAAVDDYQVPGLGFRCARSIVATRPKDEL